MKLLFALLVMPVFPAGSAPDTPARAAQAFDRCPATLPELWSLLGKLQVHSETEERESDDNYVYYEPASVSVLGERPLRFEAYFVRGQAVRITAKLPGRFQRYEPVLPPAVAGAESNCDAQRCEWMRTDEVERYSLTHSYLAQDKAGRETTLGCGYLR